MTKARGCSDARKEPQTKECGWPLETRRGKDTNFLPQPPESTNFGFSPVRPILDLGHRSYNTFVLL